VVDEDDAVARALARREVALYLPVVAGLDPTLELDAGLLDREIPDEILDLFAFAGEPARIVAQAERLFEAGADRVEFGTPHGIDERRGVELLGSRVLPALRR
jgi:5,10-methylenetetrahydromethanopterin reductase